MAKWGSQVQKSLNNFEGLVFLIFTNLESVPQFNHPIEYSPENYKIVHELFA